MLSKPIACPKPSTQLADRVAAKRAEAEQEKQFRAAVWKRDGGKCRHCGRKVIKTIELLPNKGECHHRRGRNVSPKDRVNPDAAVLLCASCHRDPKVIQHFRR